MKAKDTVMSDDEILEVCRKAVSEGKHRPSELCRAQAEISFKAGQEERHSISTIVDVGNDAFKVGHKAGIKEVVEWVQGEIKNRDPADWYSRWQAKLKEWEAK